ncbi:MAG TPA: hypothetical protein VFV58_39300 [Blastocatellia bacterium]|jgi:hypothetical protein|nr:hypothetical protein [Blastocatellia bacterium]
MTIKLDYLRGADPGCGDQPPSEAAIFLAEQIINATPEVRANLIGGVEIEWRDRSRNLLHSVTITAEGTECLE